MKMINTRRQFLTQIITAAGVAGAVASLPALAADAPAHLEESDPTAQALGYKPDTKLVDQKKYPQHQPDQHCAACALYQGAAGSKEGPCGAFGGKIVNANGWCMAYARKP